MGTRLGRGARLERSAHLASGAHLKKGVRLIRRGLPGPQTDMTLGQGMHLM